MVDEYDQETGIIWINASAAKAEACFPMDQLPLKFEH